MAPPRDPLSGRPLRFAYIGLRLLLNNTRGILMCDDVIIINKSPGVVVHPGAGNYEKTIVNGLLFKYQNKLSSIGGKLRPGIVHRIDKDTSGVIVVAKNDTAHINLSKQFSNHTIKRTYEALIWGSLKPKNGKISEKISRSIKNRQLMAVRKDKGKKAVTNYKTLKVFQNLNLPKIFKFFNFLTGGFNEKFLYCTFGYVCIFNK